MPCAAYGTCGEKRDRPTEKEDGDQKKLLMFKLRHVNVGVENKAGRTIEGWEKLVTANLEAISIRQVPQHTRRAADVQAAIH